MQHRFYAPVSGVIKIDGVDMRDLDRTWIVQQVTLPLVILLIIHKNVVLQDKRQGRLIAYPLRSSF
jgi:ABC-type bacteriocin/lantibiotic exporter with double-glycine peptidase domain